MPSEDERRIGINPERRIGNPRPVGRILPVIPASGHGIVSDVRTRIVFEGPSAGDDTIDPPPFFPLSIVEEGGSWRVTIQPGSVATWDPRPDTNPLDLYDPTINGTPMQTNPKPVLVVTPGEWVVVKIKTDIQNVITETPEILVIDSDGTHYIPDVADTDGNEGEYFIKLFKFDVLDGAVVVTSQVQSDILMSPYLWTGENRGGGIGRVLKDYDAVAATYRFRTLGEGFGTEVKQVGDLIETWLKAENVGTGVPIFVDPEDPDNPNPPPEAGDPAQFRTITGRGSDNTDGSGATKQIDVREDPVNPKNVQVVGNKKVASLIFTRNGERVYELKWDDGLVTNEAGMTIELCCEGSTETPGP